MVCKHRLEIVLAQLEFGIAFLCIYLQKPKSWMEFLLWGILFFFLIFISLFHALIPYTSIHNSLFDPIYIIYLWIKDLIITLIIFSCLNISDVLCFFRFNYKLIVQDFVSYKFNFWSFTPNTNLKPNQEFEWVYLKEFVQ